MLEWLTTRTGRDKILARFGGISSNSSSGGGAAEANACHPKNNVEKSAAMISDAGRCPERRLDANNGGGSGSGSGGSNDDESIIPIRLPLPQWQWRFWPRRKGDWMVGYFTPLFMRYSTMLRSNLVLAFLTQQIAFNVWAAIGELEASEADVATIVKTRFFFTALFVTMISATWWLKRWVRDDSVTMWVSCSASFLTLMQWMVYYTWKPIAYPLHSERTGFVWIGTTILIMLMALPVAMRLLVGITITLMFAEFLIDFPPLHRDQALLLYDHSAAICVFLIGSLTLGSAVHMQMVTKHWRSFIEARQSLITKLVIEDQSAEQERLLLSVLPEHVAVQMRQDLGAQDSEQFKKIYMSRHENVSILYADIVGFTAISSTYSAQDLVKMLNELFARFDRLAEKYHQLRIKILGDCYYCISGAPVERPDHAALCVHMGLSMVKAIKYVQAKTNSPVDMRVGIHTGAILAGILGQRQWQFDVYSRDVELANKMESSGLAGKVHISEKTLGYLKGEFEVEPAFGEKREESLRIAGLKTYFIKKVLIPFERDADAAVPKSETLESIEPEQTGASATAENGVKAPADGQQDPPTKVESIEPEQTSDGSKAPSSTENGEATHVCKDPQGKAERRRRMREENLRIFMERLKHELLGRDRHSELYSMINVWSVFKDSAVESAYLKYSAPLNLVPYTAFVLLTITYSISMSAVLPPFIPAIVFAFVQPLSVLLLIAVLMPEIVHFLYRNRTSWQAILEKDCMPVGLLLPRVGLIVTLMMGLHYTWFAVLDLSPPIDETTLLNRTLAANATAAGNDIPSFSQWQPRQVIGELHQSYTWWLLVCVSLMDNINLVPRMALLVYMLVLYTGVEFTLFGVHGYPGSHPLYSIIIFPAMALFPYVVYSVRIDRLLFRWKAEVEEQKERASDMRRRNEALVYNILPVHVAEHFMSQKQRSYDDLYSQSYDEVGVLFASMPNFSDFYSEDTVNNQGLECLRFLNEVISDFDALLGHARFQDIVKIKTIGSTYMAASGLNPSRQVQPEDPVDVRWQHLAMLVDFALELKKALKCINEQSFNHFVLKMGINHGPITAGVIGARKPHYDIWGNTVNVASRMESTGKAGAVQVTEETCQILQTFGYTFEQRGLVAVKGKGQLMTYYLQGRAEPAPTAPNPASSSPGSRQAAGSASGVAQLETLTEVDDESRENSSAGVPADSPSLRGNGSRRSARGKQPAAAASEAVNHCVAAASLDVESGSTAKQTTPLLERLRSHEEQERLTQRASDALEEEAALIFST